MYFPFVFLLFSQKNNITFCRVYQYQRQKNQKFSPKKKKPLSEPHDNKNYHQNQK